MFYKYRSFESKYKFDVFTKQDVYFASPREFNDPFESKPQIVGLDTLKEREKVVDRLMKGEQSNLNYKERKELRMQHLIRLSDKALVEKDIHGRLDYYGIFSVSPKWDQCLMWSHYSNSHKGFCIGFEFNDEFDKDLGVSYPVKYDEEYPKLHPDVFERDRDGNNENLFEATLATKSKEWSYEEEVRFIKLPINGGSGIYNFKGEKLKEVIVGACSSDRDKEELSEVLSEHMPWVNLYQAKLSDYKYGVVREPIKLTKGSS